MNRNAIAVLLLTACGVLAGCCLPAPNDRQVAGNAQTSKGPVSPTAGPEPKYLDGLGVYECVYIFMKNEHLHDPGSLEIVESRRATLEKLEGSDVWVGEIRYRSRNPLGALVLEERLALMKNGRCLMLITRSEWADMLAVSRRQGEISAEAKRKLEEIRADKKAEAEAAKDAKTQPTETAPESKPEPTTEPAMKPEPQSPPPTAPSPAPPSSNKPRPPPS